MRELSLFTGAGGGVLGSLLLGWKTVGYVEYEDYPQRILKQRMDDGILCQAPIFGDIRAFISEGYAESYQGMVDVITAGFPCQPFSVAGRQLGADDPRNMWPETRNVIRDVRPRFILLENVPGIRRYLPVVFRDLRKLGYEIRRPLRLGADDCGAPHRRKRLWMLAYTNGIGEERDKPQDREGGRLEPCREMAHATSLGQQRQGRPVNAMCTAQKGKGQGNNFISNSGWSVEPNVGRVANGVASRVDRLKAIGNGQVPIVAATAWKLLTGALQ